MRKLIFSVLLLAAVSALSAHPHFRRNSSVTFGEGKEVSLQHVTYPWNEANPDRFPADGWSPFGAKFKTTVALQSGSTSIPAGDYGLKITKSGQDFGIQLTGASQTYILESQTKHGLPMQDHLLMDVHVTGDSGYLVLRYGTFNVSGKLQAAH